MEFDRPICRVVLSNESKWSKRVLCQPSCVNHLGGQGLITGPLCAKESGAQHMTFSLSYPRDRDRR
eukprot:scaffold4031_cov135-Cylindrotheca_fusiformis.AAC.6